MSARMEGGQALRARFAPEFAAWGEGHLERDTAAEFPADQWKLIGDSGLLGLPFDKEFGGLDQDLVTTMTVLEELGHGCRDAGLNFSVSTHMVSTGVPIHRFGSRQLRERYMPKVCDGSVIGAHAITEPQGGSDATAMRTTGRKVDGGWVVNGEKCFISSGPVADLILVYVRTGGDKGPFGLSALLVDKDNPGLHVGPAVDKMGLRTSPLGSLTFTECFVPDRDVVGKPGSGFLILDHVMKWEILCSFVITLGSMRHRIDRCVEFARSRKQFGKAIGEFQQISGRIVDMRIAFETARRWLFDTAIRSLAGDDVRADVAIGKLLASEANLKSALDAVQIFGGRGYLHEYGIEKDLRDATAGTIYSGTSEVQRDKVARFLGLY
ncbi:Acyl-CoA dehydrogenase [Actinokineospora alba]|uniref:Acyl-CoA dehydrogenase n=1 Tax=Actinokineospora alba TaxID=504798 RepID=A0A1H0HBF8_9PSEU|nr:acyl-CoA dehydrogenase family protein [Actinokineospora alba]TDP64953.1 alkylation response protein AidB-like acyl-CoA dehydrogenase [Actinokineospora alba]SDH50177.1 Acyl-CoA dehydrogenase [Actinokineospora alba]SDO16468.1 Acyl-CoA dehydrogenase [Actinokineospora alba]